MHILRLGREPYTLVWELQHHLVAARQEQRIDDTLVLVEHLPVITLGRSANESDILTTPCQLQQAGIEVHRVERGGGVTYHGPGQLVGYPIMNLQTRRLGVADYMHMLEEVLIAVLADFGLTATRQGTLIGVWVQNRKIASLGARIDHGVSFHGFALNVDPDLSHFAYIMPCGMESSSITSMGRELHKPVPIAPVQSRTTEQFGRVFGVGLHDIALEQIVPLFSATGQNSAAEWVAHDFARSDRKMPD